ncbi:hypothetical protein FRX31_003035, partial [Thalictrum thalictroides]
MQPMIVTNSKHSLVNYSSSSSKSLKEFKVNAAKRNIPVRAPQVHDTVNMKLEERESANQFKTKVRRVWQIREDNRIQEAEIAVPVIRNGFIVHQNKPIGFIEVDLKGIM